MCVVVVNVARTEINVFSSTPMPACTALPFITCACAVQLEYERMGYKRTRFMFEDTGSKTIFEWFLGRMVAIAEEQPVSALEVKPLSVECMQYYSTSVCTPRRRSLFRSPQPRFDRVSFLHSLAVQEGPHPVPGAKP